jgi:hypothetical protein
MPAAVAAAAGTMVMGAAAAEVPKTRMASKGGATAKIEAAAPAKKSPVMMIVAAAVVIAGIGGAVLLMKGNGGAGAPQTKTEVPAAGNPAQVADQSKTSAPQNDTKKADPKAPVQPMKKPLVNIPANATATPVGPAPAASDSPAAVTSYWNSKLNDAGVSNADAKDALDAVNPLIPKLSGLARSNASYVQFMAYNLLADQDRECRAAKDVIANDPSAALADSTKYSSHVKVVSTVMSFCK